MLFLEFLHQAANGRALSEEDAVRAMTLILEGQATPVQIGAFLVVLRMRGETADEITGFARAMRAKSTAVDPGPGPVLDTCGTGGDGHGTFNISTVTAFVVAGAGVRVAKHGNRSISSRCGSADILEALGVKVSLTPERMGQSIREIGIGFLFAPALHPAMKHAQPARVELKMRTAFNLLGPLTNPAGAEYQVIGAPSPRGAELMAAALARIGTKCGYVVHGADGMDEVTTTGATAAWHVAGSEVHELEFTPEQFGLPRTSLENLVAPDVPGHLTMAKAVLDGAKGAPRDIVLANAALSLMAAGQAANPVDGVKRAADSIDSGAARSKLASLVEFTNS